MALRDGLKSDVSTGVSITCVVLVYGSIIVCAMLLMAIVNHFTGGG